MSSSDKAKEILKNLPTSELSYFKGRYCGPHNELLALKTYGETFSIKDVEQELFHRAIEDTILGASDDNH